jgi:2-polyprenyl-6-hydroxyphenyl methylase/3-demethylubiquinone-9 3-methyltransferase
MAAAASTVDPAEVERFSRLADEWWDPAGKFAPLHRFNPVRLQFIRDRIAAHAGRDPLQPDPLAGMRILDIGCGGGLVCEPLARMGASVVGVDAAAKNVAAARRHAETMGLAIDYRCATAEALRDAGEQFDAVLTLEVVEHVADVDLFLACAAGLVRPGGSLVLATLNRTAKAFALAVVGAEYVLGWLPRGTHDWRKFVKPSEAARGLRAGGLAVERMTGVIYSPVTGRWRLDAADLDVNYMLFAAKPA